MHTLEAALGDTIEGTQAVSGGDINAAYRVRLCGGRTVFCKVNQRAPHGMFEAEAHGLSLLSSAGSGLVIPTVLHVASHCLVLEFLTSSRVDRAQELGRGLAMLHRPLPGTRPGAERDGFIGTLPQLNRPTLGGDANWTEFFRDCRIGVQMDLPNAQRLIPIGIRRRLDDVMNRLDDFVEPHADLCVLHGDLWSGNYMFSAAGPALFDPAAYRGASEVDLAMMHLFGGFDERVFDAYFEVRPRQPGHEQRILIYQLYPLLVHVNLFGVSYLDSIERNLRQLT